MEVVYSKEQLDELLATRRHILKFTADWCGPCKRVHPVLLDLCASAKWEVVPVNVDINSDAAACFGVSCIPHVVFPNGDFIKGANEQALRDAAAQVRRELSEGAVEEGENARIAGRDNDSGDMSSRKTLV